MAVLVNPVGSAAPKLPGSHTDEARIPGSFDLDLDLA